MKVFYVKSLKFIQFYHFISTQYVILYFTTKVSSLFMIYYF